MLLHNFRTYWTDIYITHWPFNLSVHHWKNYLMILYDYNSNNIFAQTTTIWQTPTIANEYKILHVHLWKDGLNPYLRQLDNKCSTLLNTFMNHNDVDFQIVALLTHWRNSAENSIPTFKNNFIVGLRNVNKNVSIHLWYCHLPQVELTLNPLCGSRINTKLSAWAQFHITFDSNSTRMCSPGCCFIAHKNPDKCKT